MIAKTKTSGKLLRTAHKSFHVHLTKTNHNFTAHMIPYNFGYRLQIRLFIIASGFPSDS